MGYKRVVNMIGNVTNWQDYLRYKYGGKKADRFVFRLKNGLELAIPKMLLPEFKENFYEEVYFKHLPSKIFEVEKPVIVDIGANVGYFSLCALLKLRQPRVYMFEPIKRNFGELERNLAIAAYKNFHVYNMAVSDKAGELVLRFDNEQSITTSASLLSNASGGHEEVVPCTSLSDVISDNKLTKIDLLKLDCEGAEYNILYSLPKEAYAQINCISLETHEGNGAKEHHRELVAHLKSLGYHVVTRKEDFIWAYKPVGDWK